jgi:hypothetical protein
MMNPVKVMMNSANVTVRNAARVDGNNLAFQALGAARVFFFLFRKPYVIMGTRRDPGEFYANDQAVSRD